VTKKWDDHHEQVRQAIQMLARTCGLTEPIGESDTEAFAAKLHQATTGTIDDIEASHRDGLGLDAISALAGRLVEPEETKAPEGASALWDHLFAAVLALTEAGEITWTPWCDGKKTTINLVAEEDEDEDDKSFGFVGVTLFPQFDPGETVEEGEGFQLNSDAADKLSHFVLYNEGEPTADPKTDDRPAKSDLVVKLAAHLRALQEWQRTLRPGNEDDAKLTSVIETMEEAERELGIGPSTPGKVN